MVYLNMVHSEFVTIIILTNQPKGSAQANIIRMRCVDDETKSGARMMRYISHVCIKSRTKTASTRIRDMVDMGNVLIHPVCVLHLNVASVPNDIAAISKANATILTTAATIQVDLKGSNEHKTMIP